MLTYDILSSKEEVCSLLDQTLNFRRALQPAQLSVDFLQLACQVLDLWSLW